MEGGDTLVPHVAIVPGYITHSYYITDLYSILTHSISLETKQT